MFGPRITELAQSIIPHPIYKLMLLEPYYNFYAKQIQSNKNFLTDQDEKFVFNERRNHGFVFQKTSSRLPTVFSD